MRELVFVNAVPDDIVFAWQEELFIENCIKLGYTNEIHILVFVPADRYPNRNPYFMDLEKRYQGTNIKFFWFEDTENLLDTIRQINYIPLLRPYCLAKHFRNYPELKDKAIFYHDSDICFTKYFDFSPYLDDDICYMSDTKSYLNSNYFDSKIRDVLPEKLAIYENIDVLESIAREFGISRAICEANKDKTGGAQSLLKNIDAEFWEDIQAGCIRVKQRFDYNLGGLNKYFFESEDKGFQSWALADMGSLVWTLWARGMETSTPPEFDFAWATDHISKWDKVNIYHDAGVGGGNESFLFNKRNSNYVNNWKTPYQDDLSYVSKDYCSYNYVQEILKIKEKFNYS